MQLCQFAWYWNLPHPWDSHEPSSHWVEFWAADSSVYANNGILQSQYHSKNALFINSPVKLFSLRYRALLLQCQLSTLLSSRSHSDAEGLSVALRLLGSLRGAHSKPLRGLAGPQCPWGPRQAAETQAGPFFAIILSGHVRRGTSGCGVFREAGQSVSDAVTGLPLCPQHHRVVVCVESRRGVRVQQRVPGLLLRQRPCHDS